jgi:hypothetical protein
MASRHNKHGIKISSGIEYLLRASFDGLVEDPASSPITVEEGRVEVTHPNSKFYTNGDLFCRPNGTGANFDTFASGADDAGAGFPMVNGTLVGVTLSSIASRGLFHLGTSKAGNANPRFEWEHVGGLFQLQGIRITTGTFTGIVRNKTNPVNLWFLWTDALYFGLNDEIVFVQAIAPTGTRFPTLTRTLIAGEWRAHKMALSNDYENLWTGKAASTLSAEEYAVITDFLA